MNITFSFTLPPASLSLTAFGFRHAYQRYFFDYLRWPEVSPPREPSPDVTTFIASLLSTLRAVTDDAIRQITTSKKITGEHAPSVTPIHLCYVAAATLISIIDARSAFIFVITASLCIFFFRYAGHEAPSFFMPSLPRPYLQHE